MLVCLGSQLRRVFVFRQELGDPEIEQLRFPFCIRKNVARLDVAMNNQIPMRKLDPRRKSSKTTPVVDASTAFARLQIGSPVRRQCSP
jgi:hypothetical protein